MRYYSNGAKKEQNVTATVVETAGRLRKIASGATLKQHRIRRMDAEAVLRILREPPMKVAEGVAEAATIRMRSLAALSS